MNLKNYTTAQLLAAFNTRTGRDLKKFESRQIAEARVGALIRDGGLDLDAVLAEIEAQSGPIASEGEGPAATELTDAEVPAFLHRAQPEVPAETAQAAASENAPAEVTPEAKAYADFRSLLDDLKPMEAFALAIEFGKSLAPAKAPRAKAERKPREPRAEGPNKREQAAALLTRAEGATTKEILELTGWPAVSVPQLARSSKLSLRQEKDGKVTRYYATAA